MELARGTKDQAPWPDIDPAAGERPVAVLGRALSLGPQPPFLALWRCRTMEKLDEWDSFFKARRILHLSAARSGIHLSHAGCYEEACAGPPMGDGIQYIEYFSFRMGSEKPAITEVFRKRAGLYGLESLNLVLFRMGLLGPEPGGLAIWTFPTHARIEEITVDSRLQQEAGIVRAGIYRKLG
jgi:hypothetical protein